MGSELGCGIVSNRWDAGWQCGGISGTTLGCHRHWSVVELLSFSSSSQDLPHPLPIPSVLLMA